MSKKKTSLLLGRKPFPAEVQKTSPYARHSASDECANRDIVILSTPWAKDVQFNTSWGPGLEHNRTFERSPRFRMKALLCQSHYSLGSYNIAASMTTGKPPNITSTYADKVNRTSIPNDLLDIPQFERMALQDTWGDYFNLESMQTDATRRLGDTQDSHPDPMIARSAPVFTGVGPLLGTLYSFNITRMLDDKDFTTQIARVKGRFFTECLRETLRDPTAVNADVIKGETTMIEERIMVLREIGVALTVLSLVSSMLLVVVFWVSRLFFPPTQPQYGP